MSIIKKCTEKMSKAVYMGCLMNLKGPLEIHFEFSLISGVMLNLPGRRCLKVQRVRAIEITGGIKRIGLKER